MSRNNYDYYKNKYKTVTIKLDRDAEADVINFLAQYPKGPKAAIVLALRVMKASIRRGFGK